MVTTAKGLTSGYVPMGATFVAPQVAEPFFRPGAGVWWRHGYTYGGHAGAAAAAMANLDIIEREHLLDDSARLEKSLHALLAPLADLDAVAEVRSGTGAVAAVQLADPSTAAGRGQAAAPPRGRHPRGRPRRHPDLPRVRDDRRRGADPRRRPDRRPRLTSRELSPPG